MKNREIEKIENWKSGKLKTEIQGIGKYEN